jgi:capsular polysaccharide biosynthesis protein
MELRRYLSIARRRVLLILAISAAALVAGWFVTPREHTYTATTTLYVGSRSIDIAPESGEVSSDRVVGLDRLIQTFTAMLQSDVVFREAADEADVGRRAGAISANTRAEQVPGTNLIRVSVTDSDRATARALADAVAKAFVEQVREFEPRGSPAEQVVSVYQKARLPGAPDPAPLVRNLVLAGLFGLIVAAGVVTLLEVVDISLRSSEDVDRWLELPVLGVVPALGDELPVPPALRVQTMSMAWRPAERVAPGG